MAGIPHSSGAQPRRKQEVLDYLCDHIGEAFTAEDVAEAMGIRLDEVKIAIEELAYEKEVAKERPQSGHAIYRRKA
jgi:hypothetical protein